MHVRVARERGLERRQHLGQRDLGQEPQPPEVHAEDRGVAPRLAHPVGEPEQRAVAAEHEHEVHAAA